MWLTQLYQMKLDILERIERKKGEKESEEVGKVIENGMVIGIEFQCNERY